MAQVNRILVPVDFSDSSRAALRYALGLGTHFDAELVVVHVWEPPRFVGPEVMFYPPEHSQDTVLEVIQEEAIRQTKEFVAEEGGEHSVSVSTRVVAGIPYAAIVDLAKDEGFDLIVMGTHGRSGLSHFFVGSVAEKVVRHAPCPTLTIREARPRS